MWNSLFGPQRLREAVRVVQAGHLLVPGLRVQPDDVAVLELRDEAERMPDGRQQDVAAGLVRLGLERDLDVVALVLDVAGDGVDALAVAVERGVQILGAVVLAAFPATPHDEGLGAELSGQVDVAQHLAEREPADRAIVGGEAAVLEHRVGEQVGGDHLDGDVVAGAGIPEAGDQPVAGGGVASRTGSGRRRGR